jgi:hypothetical protein
MKPQSYAALFVIVLLASACKKDPKINPIVFPNAVYQSVSPYNSNGEPDNLLKDTVSEALYTYVHQTLTYGQNLTISHPEFFTGTNTADIAISQSSDVYVTFFSGKAGLSNTLAFYTYPTGTPPTSDKDVKLINYIFPNAGRNSPLVLGDKIKIGNFDAGTSIGFVILQNAWDTTKGSINSNSAHFCSTDALNPETDPKLKRHAVLLNYTAENKSLISFEDVDRSSPNCDNDFSDIIFYCTVDIH